MWSILLRGYSASKGKEEADSGQCSEGKKKHILKTLSSLQGDLVGTVAAGDSREMAEGMGLNGLDFKFA